MLDSCPSTTWSAAADEEIRAVDDEGQLSLEVEKTSTTE
ncbi:hypothetical protein HJIV1_gp4 [Haloterrigena jeotgali icosahedral virus 1]|nr:hypothetical protein HJIV1_gp4 [Haloterrigena jeotgali icosahedral virus 1]